MESTFDTINRVISEGMDKLKEKPLPDESDFVDEEPKLKNDENDFSGPESNDRDR